MIQSYYNTFYLAKFEKYINLKLSLSKKNCKKIVLFVFAKYNI